MFCHYCATELPDEANYCWKCGKPQARGLDAPERQWQTCQIECVVARKPGFMSAGTSKFVATVTGPQGEQVVRESSAFGGDPTRNEEDARRLLTELVSALLQQGWEPAGMKDRHDDDWWRHQFKREK